MTALMEVKDLAFRYTRDRMIFQNVSFELVPGEIMCLLGPNGAGKSTLLNCLAGLAHPTHGVVEVLGKNVENYSARSLAKHIGYVRQNISVTYGYTVREYLVMGAAPRIGMFSSPKKEDYERVAEAIEDLSLQKLADRAVSKLSGGERQRVAIARAIVQNPEIILFDEPTSALDYGNQIRVMRTIQQLCERGYAVIMTTHNPDQPILLGGKVAMLNSSGTLAIGDAEKTLTGERLSELYGTDLHLVFVNEVDRMACVSSKL
ncbi:MAG: ABC transporter ATP-binding protein [Coriobacteriales bacterium]|nr:ABC transporter ATP-binding protein [Coriobacteriales bacterium]